VGKGTHANGYDFVQVQREGFLKVALSGVLSLVVVGLVFGLFRVVSPHGAAAKDGQFGRDGQPPGLEPCGRDLELSPELDSSGGRAFT
jgi:hypothetical protein